MSKLYIFGDSYSTPGFCVEPQDSFWGLAAQALGRKIDSVVNYSWGFCNFDSLSHIIVSSISQFNYDDYLLIGIPTRQRFSMFNPGANRELSATVYNRELVEQSKELVLCHSGLNFYCVKDMGKEFVNLWETSWAEAQHLRQLLMLDGFLSQHIDISHVLYLNLSAPFQPLTQWPTLSELQKQAMSNNRMILFNDTYYSVNLNVNEPVDFIGTGWHGHHGPAGNKHYYDLVINPKMQELKWI